MPCCALASSIPSMSASAGGIGNRLKRSGWVTWPWTSMITRYLRVAARGNLGLRIVVAPDRDGPHHRLDEEVARALGRRHVARLGEVLVQPLLELADRRLLAHVRRDLGERRALDLHHADDRRALHEDHRRDEQPFLVAVRVADDVIGSPVVLE